MIRSGLAGLLAIGAALPAVADDVPVGLQPYQIVRSLERVQDRLAGGDHASQPMQRKLLEMARSLMVQPKLVMLDEPMAGVNPALTHFKMEPYWERAIQGLVILLAVIADGMNRSKNAA